jgi:organic radical activating enzyme
LSNSGEPAVKTIFPSVIVSQQLGWSGHTQVAQYLKFVIEPDKFAESELLAVIDFYDKELMNSNRMLIPPSSVYLMPEGVSKERQLAIMPQVATIAMRLGFSLCVRLHTLLWDNHRGT